MQQLGGAFPTFADPNISGAVNIDDEGGNPRTPGGQVLAVLSAQPTIVKPWTVYGFGVQFQGMLLPTGGPMYGQLGQLLASLIIGSIVAPTSKLSAFAPPPASALANLQTIWDGSQDPSFPFGSTAFPTVPPKPPLGVISRSFQLPIPQAMNPGDQLAVGLWLTPSLLTNGGGLSILNAVYTVLYG